MPVVSELHDQIIFLPTKNHYRLHHPDQGRFKKKKKVKKIRTNNQPCGSKLQLKIKPCRNLDMKTEQAKTIFSCKLKQHELIDDMK